MTDGNLFKSRSHEVSRRMRALRIFEKDLDEQFVRSSGPGGQNVNKLATCVILSHCPTGIKVKCQKERSQALNRVLARELLCRKVEGERRKVLARIQQEREKRRRQKRKKPAALKAMILEEKRRQAVKKQNRRRIKLDKTVFDD